jgi:Domain of unknown function (DUF4249)
MRPVPYITFMIILTGSCKEKYLPSITSPSTGYLVTEGFINSGQGPTTITLSRSIKLVDSVDILYEHNALVNIESNNNETFPLSENGNGVYVSSSLNLNNNQKYHLTIKTQDGKEYASDFATVKRTPDIDSISWKQENGGVRIYVSTHDPQNNTKYYHWKFEETWEIHSVYYSSLVYIYDQNSTPIAVGYRNPDGSVDTTIYKCWNTVNSTNINLGSSEKLSKDLIYLPLVYIDPGSEKLSVLYSINVRQYALSHEGYLFFQKIKKNTEQLGSIFDPQPSELKGNIHCLTNPAETVIGYIDISEEKILRKFISRADLQAWDYRADCITYKIDNNRDSILEHGIGLSPTTPASFGIAITSFYAANDKNCIDCTLRGTNVRPSFWP